MRNIRLVIEYDGTNYMGWQTQKKNLKTIQGTIEKVLREILQEKVNIIGSGRTDRGVHALGQVANFKTKSSILTSKLQQALNSLLPPDIVIKKAEDVGLEFHARFTVRSKIYRYTILNSSTPRAISRDYYIYLKYPLDVVKMQKEAKCLLGRHNFKSFQAADRAWRKKDRKSETNIKMLNISKKDDFIYIDIEATGFLYNMVRNIVGTLIEVGRGKFPGGRVKAILEKRDRTYAGPTAAAKGLCLVQVKY
ncbi:MAG: tRNA pseudouridine(38-40) synthase TruA [Candidatus Omnitrophota bacterium]